MPGGLVLGFVNLKLNQLQFPEIALATKVEYIEKVIVIVLFSFTFVFVRRCYHNHTTYQQLLKDEYGEFYVLELKTGK